MTDQSQDAQDRDWEFDFEAAEKFLARLDPEAQSFEFQTIDQAAPDAKVHTLPQAFFDSFDKPATRDALAEFNQNGAGIFVAFNLTDGQGRAKRNVLAIRALVLDLDSAPLDPVLKCKLKPHVIVETSPDRWQALWLVENNVPMGSLARVPELARRKIRRRSRHQYARAVRPLAGLL
jgi:hypothetical protein